jgi:hypothetical protein
LARSALSPSREDASPNGAYAEYVAAPAATSTHTEKIVLTV